MKSDGKSRRLHTLVRILLAVSLVGAAAAAGGVAWRKLVRKAPSIEVGASPKGYALSFAQPGSTVDLGDKGAVRLGGQVEGDVAQVWVTVGGETRAARIDRQVDPPVWTLAVTPPSAGTYQATVDAVGPDGASDTSEIRFTAKWPDPEDVVVTPDLVVASEQPDAPEVVRYDDATGEITMRSVAAGSLYPGTVLVSASTKVAPGGFLRVVTVAKQSNGEWQVSTRQGRLDEAIYQAAIASEAGFAAPVGGMDVTVPIELGLPKDVTAANAVKTLGDRAQYKLDLGSDEGDGAGQLLFGLGGQLRATASIDIRYEFRGWFKPPVHLKSIDLGATFVGVAATSLRFEADLADDIAKAIQRLTGTKRKLASSGDIFEVDIGRATFMVGPVPVVVNGEVGATYDVSGELTAAFQVSGVSQVRLGGRVAWSGAGLSVVPVREAKFIPDVRVMVAGAASVQIGLSLGVELYGALDFAVNPGLKAEASLETDMAVLSAVTDPAKFVAKVDASLNAVVDAEFELDFFSVNFQAKQNLGSFPLASCSGEVAPLVARFDVKCGLGDSGGELSSNADPVGSEGSGPGAGDSEPVADETLSMMFVLDVSSSMSEPDGAGGIRIDGAREAIRDFMDGLNPSVRAGLRSYPDDGDCGVGQLLVPVQRVDRTAIQTAIEGLTPSGNTPTHLALQAAADDLPQKGYRTIVLVSDGESNCGGENGVTCDVARQLAQSGITTVNAVGFQISAEGAAELQCIADATKGNYATVDTSEQLVEHLEELSGPKIELSLVVPDSVDTAATDRPSARVQVTVNNVGSQDATNVTAKLEQAGLSGLSIPDSGRLLGTIRAGERTEIEWNVPFPSTSAAAEAKWNATVDGENISSTSESMTSTLIGSDPSELRAKLGSVFDDVQSFIVMGDDVGFGTPTSADTCEEPRSSVGRMGDGWLVSDAEILACVGATTADLGTASGAREQLSRFRSAIDRRPDSAVLVAAGASDVGMPQLLSHCLESDVRCSDSKAITGFEDRLGGLRVGIAGAAATLAQYSPSGTPIVFFAYPKVFPSGGAVLDRCAKNATDLLTFNRYVERLNDTISAAVSNARGVGVNAYFVASSEHALTPVAAPGSGQSLCSADGPLQLDPEKSTTSWAEANGASALSASLLTDSPAWEAPTTKRSAQVGREPDADAAGRGFRFVADGFEPNSHVVVVDDTQRVPLGWGEADADGRASGTVYVPPWVERSSAPVVLGSNSRSKAISVRPRLAAVGPPDRSDLWRKALYVAVLASVASSAWLLIGVRRQMRRERLPDQI